MDSRPNHENRVTNTATSEASNARKSHGLGRARANHGRSHNPYCGEYTLLVRRNTTRRGKPNVHRGKPGRRVRRSHQTSTATTMKSPRDSSLTIRMDQEHPAPPWRR